MMTANIHLHFMTIKNSKCYKLIYIWGLRKQLPIQQLRTRVPTRQEEIAHAFN